MNPNIGNTAIDVQRGAPARANARRDERRRSVVGREFLPPGAKARRAACAPVSAAVFIAAWLALAPAAGSELADRTRLLVDERLLPAGGEVEISVGELDARLNLAPCRRQEPFIPSGARLWGRTSLGVRCVDGANWSVFVPVQIRVYGPAPVAARPVARGQALGPDDVRIERVELTQWPPGVLVAAEAIDGRIATRAISAGEPLRRDLVRAPAVVQPGDRVKVVYGGAGFAVVTEGKALTAAADGQSTQVALEAGRVLSGTARSGRVVELK